MNHSVEVKTNRPILKFSDLKKGDYFHPVWMNKDCPSENSILLKTHDQYNRENSVSLINGAPVAYGLNWNVVKLPSGSEIKITVE